jgi:hypothetical protein
MKKLAPGALAGLAAALLLAAPAYAANVTVRIEGQDQTLVPRTLAQTSDDVVLDDPNSDMNCSGRSAMGAIHRVTGGAYEGEWQGHGWLLTTIKGEFHYDPFPADPARYWSFWVNYKHMDVGLCDPTFRLQEGDDVIILVDCYSATSACEKAQPLELRNVPPTVAPGQPMTIRVDEHYVEDPTAYPTVTRTRPSEGATVSAGGQTATTGAGGTATLTFPAAGPVSIAVTKSGRVRTAGVTCVTTGNDGSCGTQLPPNTPLGTGDPDDKTAPVAAFSGLKKGRVFSRKRAPRELRGTVSADPSGIKSVRLSIMRKRKGRCWAFDGKSERFERHRCGGSRSFRIGDRADWSYLLPERLARGRYTIRVAAIDKAGNDSSTQTRIRVR